MPVETTIPIWKPRHSLVSNSHLRRYQESLKQKYGLTFQSYDDLHHWSINNISTFWQSVWDYCDVIASQPARTAVDANASIWSAKWFEGARLNFAENMLRYRDTHTAIVSVVEGGERREVSYQELYDGAVAFAAGLKSIGIQKGDRVGGILPNSLDAMIAMLGTASLGAVWTCCSPDFGVGGILDRFSQTQPKVIIGCKDYQYNGKTHNCEAKIYGVAKALNNVKAVIITGCEGSAPGEMPGLRLYTFSQFSRLSRAPLEFVQLPFDHPLYILYSSGTTGKPKCIVHGAGGTLLQHLKEYIIHYDVDRKDTFFYYTTTGWTMWNILASALLTGCKVIAYDGSPFFPDHNRLLNLIDDEGITVFGVSAKYLSAIEKAGLAPKHSHKLQNLRMILSTGSPLAKESYDYVYRDFKKDVCLGSICGGTDIISAFIEATYTLPVYAGQLQCKGLGMAVEIWDDDGNPVIGRKGELVCTKPFPSRPLYFWDDPDNERYYKSYFSRFPGVWAQGDFGEQTTTCGFIIYGRSDAVLNPGGVRIGTAEIYRQVEQFDEILDSVCIGQQWEDDVRVVLFVVLREGLTLDNDLKQKIKQQIRQNTTPRHVPAKIIQVTDIPRTLSGKNVEIAVRDVVHGREVKNIESLANPQALDLYANLPDLQS